MASDRAGLYQHIARTLPAAVLGSREMRWLHVEERRRGMSALACSRVRPLRRKPALDVVLRIEELTELLIGNGARPGRFIDVHQRHDARQNGGRKQVAGKLRRRAALVGAAEVLAT